MAESPADEVQRYIDLFEASDMQTLRIVTPTLELLLSRQAGAEAATPAPAPPAAAAPAPADSAAPEPAVLSGHVVRAPMVGTVYRAPEPGKPPFVEAGDRVDEKTTVCLVEAMKVFTAVVAGVSGTVAEIFVANGEFVEFDQPLLRLDPDTTTGA